MRCVMCYFEFRVGHNLTARTQEPALGSGLNESDYVNNSSNQDNSKIIHLNAVVPIQLNRL